MARLRRGFSLAELMVTVAIIGVLAAMGFTSWQQSQWRSKRAEVPANVAGIKVAEQAYYAAWSTYLKVEDDYPAPLSENGDDKAARAWPAIGLAGNFDALGWRPFGEVRGAYAIYDADSTTFTITGMCNVDGDSQVAVYTATDSGDGSWAAETVF